MKKLFVLFFLIGCTTWVIAQPQKPKLIVGIVVDQMRQEYLYRFKEKFGEGGFKKLMQDGFMAKNAHYNYVPTNTAPGHTSVYTGTTPAYHGIISNGWYDKKSKTEIYCAGDTTESTVGSTSDNGEMSPRNMLTTTITDELRLGTQKQAKVIGISIKDRGAIFPAGHTGEAYWYDSETGNFITSTYYHDKLPDWVQKFNNQKLADQYLKQTWEPLNPLNTYTESGPDDNIYETPGRTNAFVFPYNFSKLKDAYGLVPASPFGNDILKDMALAALEGEQLGTHEFTDFLAVSFSSTDYVGHQFGPNSVEVEDTYLRLDKNIETIINALDKKVGKGNYTIFLTADHAVAEVPQFLIDNKVPAGYFTEDLDSMVSMALTAKYGEGKWIEDISNAQVFLNHTLIFEKKINLHEIQEFIAQQLMAFEGIEESYPAYVINWLDYNASGVKGLMTRGYNQERSGDVLFGFKPGWFASGNKTGTTHGSAFTYDTHVPMLWYGYGIKSGSSVKYHPITDIAATLAMMLEIKLPNGATGQPIEELFE